MRILIVEGADGKEEGLNVEYITKVYENTSYPELGKTCIRLVCGGVAFCKEDVTTVLEALEKY